MTRLAEPAPLMGAGLPSVEEALVGEVAALRVVLAQLLKEVVELQSLGADGMTMAYRVNHESAAKFDFNIDDAEREVRVRQVMQRALDQMHSHWSAPTAA